MSQLKEQISQFRKMASDDPDNEIGHYRLGKYLKDDGQHEEAVRSFQRTLELSPEFSVVYNLLGDSLAKLGKKDEAVEVLQKGFTIADERGDLLPRDEMAKLLVELGQPAPVSKRSSAPAGAAGSGNDTGFRCVRPGCTSGRYARKLEKPPMSGEMGQAIHQRVCADCWDWWLRDMSVKVINEMRLDLSTERGAEVYDQTMRETLGVE
jgi:tetratricopeptide (TPR) repeat protein